MYLIGSSEDSVWPKKESISFKSDQYKLSKIKNNGK